MHLPFKQYHLFKLLDAFGLQSRPIDHFVSTYFKANKALGSKDRLFIAQSTYELIKWKLTLESLLNFQKFSWQKAWELLQDLDLPHDPRLKTLQTHEQLSCPKFLYDLFCLNFGTHKTQELCLTNNTPPPIYIRVNTFKTSRDYLFNQWKKQDLLVEKCKKSPLGIEFKQKIQFNSLPEFKQGFFEVQDESSQCTLNHFQPKPGETVLDFCAGSGGKTLAFSPGMKNKGQIFLHDIRTSILKEAKKRLKRAGIQNIQFLNSNDIEKKKRLKKNCDWVLADVPCSGTGTLRRNLDSKWRLKASDIGRLVNLQRHIFEQALSFVKPKGFILYVTCSLLRQENESQMDYFLSTYDLSLINTLKTFPKQNEGDGFFAALLQRK